MELPLYITEITIPGKGENGSVLQGKIVENLYRLWFSTPNMAGISWWNLGDGTAFENENNVLSGLLDKEINPKPTYSILDKLINQELINQERKTNLKITADSNGDINFRGYYGKYKISVKCNGKLREQGIDLTKSGNNKFIIRL